MRIRVACICHWKISCTCFGWYLCVCRIVANQFKVLLFELVFSFEFSCFFIGFELQDLDHKHFYNGLSPNSYFISLFIDTICCLVQQQSSHVLEKGGEKKLFKRIEIIHYWGWWVIPPLSLGVQVGNEMDECTHPSFIPSIHPSIHPDSNKLKDQMQNG